MGIDKGSVMGIIAGASGVVVWLASSALAKNRLAAWVSRFSLSRNSRVLCRVHRPVQVDPLLTMSRWSVSGGAYSASLVLVRISGPSDRWWCALL